LQDSYDCTEGTYEGLKEGEIYYNDPTGGCAGGVAGALWLSAFTNTPGYNGGSVSMTGCTNSGSVINEASTTTGGIAGYVFNGSVDPSCVNSGAVSGMTGDTSTDDEIGFLFLTNNYVDTSGISKNIIIGGTNADTAAVLYGEAYSITLTAKSGYSLGKVVVKMGGVNITGDAFRRNTVQIHKVTGNIVIRAAASNENGSDHGSSGVNEGSPMLPVTLTQSENGSVTVIPGRARVGGEVTITTVPDDYMVKEVVVTDTNNRIINVIDKGDGTYTFIMPAGGARVAVTFQEALFCDGGLSCPARGYKDVDISQWYHEYVDYVIGKSLMVGYNSDIFGVNDKMTREQLVYVLYRMTQEPAVSGVCGFTDAEPGSYYYAALVWAEQNGIIGGYVNGTFGIGDSITREQAATILFKYAQYKRYDVSIGEETNILSYNDAFDISEYAYPALQWTVGTGIIVGDDYGNLNPQSPVTRAEFAAILARFSKNAAV